jgi:mycothiol synthase
MAALSMRDFTPADYGEMRHVINSAWPDYETSVEALKHDDRAITKNGYFLKRYVVVSSRRVVAFGDVSERIERYKQGRLHLTIEVHPRFRRTGAWKILFERLELIARKRNVEILTARGSSRDRFTTGCLTRNGFEVASRDIESRMDLRRISERSLEKAVAGKEIDGVAFTTLDAERDSNPSLTEAIYQMENQAGRDVPATDRWRRMSLTEYRDLVHKSPSIVPDAWMIAKERDRYVGESYLLKGEGYPRFLMTGFTCVLREFRGRGIAESLKLRALLWAKKRGVESVKTWNDSTNVPILRLNGRLGFRKYAVWFKLEKKLSP